jgi:CRISPR-associated protein (Cas_Cas02710)
MRSTLSQAIKVVFNPETIVPFLIGSICLAVVGNAIYDILKNQFGTTTFDLIRLGAIALLILVLMVVVVCVVISRQLSRLSIEVPFEVRQKQLNRKYRGLILLVSKSEACATAIQFHLGKQEGDLERCWLVCSQQSLQMAQELRQQFPKVCMDNPILINDVYNPLEFYDRIQEIYTTRLPPGWQESDVIADYTGMTAHASVGAVLACVGTVRPLQYTPAQVNEQGRTMGSLAPIRVDLRRRQVGSGVRGAERRGEKR